jgi:hypothetical protein
VGYQHADCGGTAKHHLIVTEEVPKSRRIGSSWSRWRWAAKASLGSRSTDEGRRGRGVTYSPAAGAGPARDREAGIRGHRAQSGKKGPRPALGTFPVGSLLSYQAEGDVYVCPQGLPVCASAPDSVQQGKSYQRLRQRRRCAPMCPIRARMPPRACIAKLAVPADREFPSNWRPSSAGAIQPETCARTAQFNSSSIPLGR